MRIVCPPTDSTHVFGRPRPKGRSTQPEPVPIAYLSPFGTSTLSRLICRASEILFLPHLRGDSRQRFVTTNLASHVLCENSATTQNWIGPRTDSPFVKESVTTSLDSAHKLDCKESSGKD